MLIGTMIRQIGLGGMIRLPSCCSLIPTTRLSWLMTGWSRFPLRVSATISTTYCLVSSTGCLGLPVVPMSHVRRLGVCARLILSRLIGNSSCRRWQRWLGMRATRYAHDVGSPPALRAVGRPESVPRAITYSRVQTRPSLPQYLTTRTASCLPVNVPGNRIVGRYWRDSSKLANQQSMLWYVRLPRKQL